MGLKNDFGWLRIAAAVFGLWFVSACILGSGTRAEHSRTYHKPYDEVWEAVEGLLADELGCVDKKKSKRRGYFITEWVYQIDTTGTSRWMIDARLDKKKDGVLVTLIKTVQLQDDVSRTLRKYNKTQKRQDAAGPQAGWKTTTALPQELEGLYRSIDLRLGE